MHIVQIQGGLGNQMFQYAFYRALQYYYPKEEIKACHERFLRYTHNGFELEKVFHIKDIELASDAEILMCKNSKIMFENSTTGFLKHFDKIEGDVFWDGYFHSYKYSDIIRDKIRDTFQFSKISEQHNVNYLKQISIENSVSVHIRRGDFVRKEHLHLAICDLDYYQKAIMEIKNKTDNPKFFIITDDMDWAKKKFMGNEYVFIEGNKHQLSYRDMQLMSYCKHHILTSASSFGWWGMFLNKNVEKIVVVPQYWGLPSVYNIQIENLFNQSNLIVIPFDKNQIDNLEKNYKKHRFLSFIKHKAIKILIWIISPFSRK